MDKDLQEFVIAMTVTSPIWFGCSFIFTGQLITAALELVHEIKQGRMSAVLSEFGAVVLTIGLLIACVAMSVVSAISIYALIIK